MWSKIAPTVNLDPLVAAAGYEKLIPSELVGLHKPQGHWIALPMQVYRTTTLFMSRPAMKKVGADQGAQDLGRVQRARHRDEGRRHHAGRQRRHPLGRRHEARDRALSASAATPIARALMKLDPKALKGAEMLEAFAQLRKFANWMDPAIAAQHYSVNLPKFLKGDMGMLMMGGWAQGVIKNLGGNLDDVLITSVPQNEGKPVFVLNADSMIFWQRKEPDLTAGQQLLAKLMMQKDVQEKYSQTTGSIPVRTDVDLSGPAWTDGQREASAVLIESFKSQRVLLSLAHNMAQTNPITAAMIDVLTEYVHNDKVTPEQGAARLAQAVDNARG